jgi:hypothetical protein
MAGCFGNSAEDRMRENELNRYLDKCDEDEMTEEEREAESLKAERYEAEREMAWERRRDR